MFLYEPFLYSGNLTSSPASSPPLSLRWWQGIGWPESSRISKASWILCAVCTACWAEKRPMQFWQWWWWSFYICTNSNFIWAITWIACYKERRFAKCMWFIQKQISIFQSDVLWKLCCNIKQWIFVVLWTVCCECFAVPRCAMLLWAEHFIALCAAAACDLWPRTGCEEWGFVSCHHHPKYTNQLPATNMPFAKAFQNYIWNIMFWIRRKSSNLKR